MRMNKSEYKGGISMSATIQIQKELHELTQNSSKAIKVPVNDWDFKE